MNSRRTVLGLAAISALAAPHPVQGEQAAAEIYLHGLVWNRQLPAPMNEWLIRFDARTSIPIGAATGFATLGDDFQDGVDSHAVIQAAVFNAGRLTLTASISESKSAALIGQTVRIEGKLLGTAIEALTVTIGAAGFGGAGFFVAAPPSPPGPLVPIPFPNGGTQE